MGHLALGGSKNLKDRVYTPGKTDQPNFPGGEQWKPPGNNDDKATPVAYEIGSG